MTKEQKGLYSYYTGRYVHGSDHSFSDGNDFNSKVSYLNICSHRCIVISLFTGQGLTKLSELK